jgi:hypothetical protein
MIIFLDKDLDAIQRPRLRSNSNLEQTISGNLILNAGMLISFGSKNGSNKLNVKNGAGLSLISGKSIKFMPGTKSEKGAKITAKVIPSSSKKSGIVQSKISTTYPLVSPYLAKVTQYDDDENMQVTVVSKIAAKSVTIYPNPVTNNLFVRFARPSNASITISNTLGKCVYSNAIEWTDIININIQPFPSGIYFISINSNEFQSRSKIVKTGL